MRNTSLVMVFLFIISCGKIPANEEETAVNSSSMALNTSDELPQCSIENENQLVYLIDEGVFKTCKSRSWLTIDVMTEKDRYEISKTIVLPPYADNFCDSGSINVECFFCGGKIVIYSDGSYFMSAAFETTVESIRDTWTPSAFFSSDAENGFILMSARAFINGSSTPTAIWLGFSILSENAVLLADANKNGEPDENDEIISDVVTEEGL